MNFENLNIIKPILDSLAEAGYSAPTEIQNSCIPPVLDKKDIMGFAQTGTGKTAAFAIPIIQLLSETKNKHQGIRALVLVPTRELAIQVDQNFKQYSTNLKVSSLAVFGGVSQVAQVNALKQKPEVLIATPGRLLDFMQQKLVSFGQLEILVLDEADRMLDMGFNRDVLKIIAKIPEKRQTLLFSATMPLSIKKLAAAILRHPVEINVTPVSSTTELVDQSVYFVEKKDKTRLLIDLLKDTSISRSLVFTRTKHGADRLAKQLTKTGIYAGAIHGNKSQNARQRTLKDFKDNKIRVLIATDIAARGIDITELPHVVNYELPQVAETYVHRIGRTGRAGNSGVAISFCDKEEEGDLKNIQKLIGFNLKVIESI